MKWLRRKRKGPSPDQMEALRAKVHADIQYRKALAEQERAGVLAGRLREIRERNHFGESLDYVFGSRP